MAFREIVYAVESTCVPSTLACLPWMLDLLDVYSRSVPFFRIHSVISWICDPVFKIWRLVWKK